MIRLFLIKEPIVRRLPLAVALAVVAGQFIGKFFGDILRTGRLHSDLGLDETSLFGVILPAFVSILMLFVGVLPLQVRVHEYERTLPVARRDIALGRLLGLFCFLVAVLAAVTGSVVYRIPDLISPEVVLGFSLRSFASLLLAVLVLAAYKPQRDRLSGTSTVVLGLLALAAVLLSGYVDSWWIPLVYLALCLPLGWNVFTGLEGTELLPEPDGSRAAGQSPDQTSGQTSGESPLSSLVGPLRWTLMRCTFLRPRCLLLLIIGAVFLGFVGQEQLLALLWFPVWVSASVASISLGALRELGSLPIDRKTFLRYSTWPSLVALLAGFSLWLAVPRVYSSIDVVTGGVMLDTYSEDTLEGSGEHTVHLRVPAALWAMSAGEPDPVIESPFGESFAPPVHPVFWGSDTVLYNPYDVGEDSTVRFVCWQASRARAALGLGQMSAEEVHARWFAELDLDQTAYDAYRFQRERTETGFGGSVAATYPLPMAGFLGLVALFLWALGVSASLLRARPTPATPALRRSRRLRHGLLIALVLVAFMTVFTAVLQDRALQDVVPHALFQGLDAVLGSQPLAWLALDLVVFLLLDLGFRRWVPGIDPPVNRSGWSREELPVY